MTPDPMTTAATREALARFTRKLVDDHDEWDSPHTFATLYPDGGGVRVGTWATLDVPPGDYPARILAIVAGEVAKTLAGGGAELPCAFALRIEAHCVEAPPDDADPLHHELLDADRAARALHTRPDADEVCDAWLVDVDENVWHATKKRRGEPGTVEEHHWPAGSVDSPGGTMLKALVACSRGMRTVRRLAC